MVMIYPVSSSHNAGNHSNNGAVDPFDAPNTPPLLGSFNQGSIGSSHSGSSSSAHSAGNPGPFNNEAVPTVVGMSVHVANKAVEQLNQEIHTANQQIANAQNALNAHHQVANGIEEEIMNEGTHSRATSDFHDLLIQMQQQVEGDRRLAKYRKKEL